jgi:SAM-dependent methyltransferase
MNRAYWDDLADDYDQQIFSVLQSDNDGQIAACIAKHASPTKTAADLGCGPGQITPLLAQNFSRVHACDISRGLLQSARERCADHGNVDFHRYDLSGSKAPPFEPVDFVLCVNVLLTADLETRERLWERVTSVVDYGGTLLLVVPSLESALYTNFRRLDSHVRAGASGDQAISESLPRDGNVPQLEQGVRGIDGVETKHFLREEIIVQLADRSLQVAEITKITYDWTTEFAEPPDWLGPPHPWNWLVIANRP